MRQYLKKKEGDEFKEDVDDKGGAYGHRDAPAVKGSDSYYDVDPDTGDRVPNQPGGSNYEGRDAPTTNDAGKWTFDVRVIDTCNGNKEVTQKTSPLPCCRKRLAP